MSGLDSSRWRRVSEILDQVWDLPTEERSSRLDELCGSEEDLRSETLSLLHARDDAERALGETVSSLAAPLLDSLAADDEQMVPFERLGPYRLVRALGSGGMGTVILAERAEGGLEGLVAIKLVKRGMDTDEIVRRFRHERQVLSRLSHDAIARFFDGGAAPDGRPYYVMEYVRGIPITEYCERLDLDVEDRLDLFLHVCAAVQYAHQNGVIHRDIKPSNILVTEAGAPKLLDFGIAKVLEETGGADSTQTRGALMTPEHAAPEQLRAGPTTTATDVYALGVLLYELVTGGRPLSVRGLPHHEMVKVILEQDPVRPSASSGRMSDRRRERLRGDLDAVTLKALAKSPRERYATVEQLAEDLHRHQVGRPVRARPPLMRYRASKFVSRHRVGVAASVVFAAFLLAVAGLSTAFLVSRAQQASVIAVERDKAEEAASFLEGLFLEADPSMAGGDTATVFDILERGAERIDTELQDQPEVRAALLHVLGRVYRNLGALDESEPMLLEALELRRATIGVETEDVAATMEQLGILMTDRGRLDQAQKLHEEALRVRRASSGTHHEQVSSSLNHLAKVHFEAGRYEEAEALWRETLTMRRRLGSDAAAIATILANLGALLAEARGYFDEEAESMLREAIDLYISVHGEDHPSVARARNNLGAMLVGRREFDESETLYRLAIETDRRVYGSEHPQVAAGLTNLAVVLHYQGTVDEAASLYREALGIYRSTYGESHPLVATLHNSLAALLQETGRTAGAEALWRETLRLRRELLNPDHPDLATTLNNYAIFLRDDARRLEESEEAFREALDIRRRALAPHHVDLENTVRNYGLLLQQVGRYDPARSLLRESVEIRRALLPPDAPEIAGSLVLLGVLLSEMGDVEGAIAVLEESARIRASALGEDHWLTANTRSHLGNAFARAGRFDQAEPLLLDSYEIIRGARGQGFERTVQARERIVALYEAWGREGDAARWRGSG